MVRLTTVLCNYNATHRQFFARTIMVKDNNVGHAFRTLNRLMSQEDILKELRIRRFREKPYQTRNRISYEICRAIYNDDMKRKIEFLMRLVNHSSLTDAPRRSASVKTNTVINAFTTALNRRGPSAPIDTMPENIVPKFKIDQSVNKNCEIFAEGAVLHVRGDHVQPQPLIDDSLKLCLLWNGEVFRCSSSKPSTPYDLKNNDTSWLFDRLRDAVRNNAENDTFDAVYTLLTSIEGPYAVVIFVNDRVYFARDCFGRRSLLWNVCNSSSTECDHFLLSSCMPDIVKLQSFASLLVCDQVPHHGLFCMNLDSDQRTLKFRPWPMFAPYFAHDRISHSNCSVPEVSDHFTAEIVKSFYEPVQTLLKHTELKLHIYNLKVVLQQSTGIGISVCPEEVFRIVELLKHSFDAEKLFVAALSYNLITSLTTKLYEHLKDAVQRRCIDFHRSSRSNDNNADDMNNADTETADVAVLFSGGLDSTILAALLHECMPPDEAIALHNVAFCSNVADSDGKIAATDELCAIAPDRVTAELAFRMLKTKFPTRAWIMRRINITRSELEAQRRERIAQVILPQTTVLDDSLGCALWFAARGNFSTTKTTKPPLVIFSGLGADELFGGYSRHFNAACAGNWQALQSELFMDIARIGARNCGRDDRVVSDHGCELRQPFLDEQVVKFALERVPVQLKVLTTSSSKGGNDVVVKRGVGDKFLLRLMAYKQLGLQSIAQEPKRAMQFGTRIAKLEVRNEQANDKCQRLITAAAAAERNDHC